MTDNNKIPMTDSKEEQKSDWKQRELGALWRREGKQQNFLSGMIRIGEFGVEKEIKIVVFTNKGKIKNERAPDFIVYEDRPRPTDQLPEDASKENSPEEVLIESSSEEPEEVPAGF